MEEMMNISFQSGGDVKAQPAVRGQTIYDWTIDELKTLCANIKDASLRLTKAVNAPYNRIENRLDWEHIAFGEHDADECRTKWQQLCTNIRTYRTMAEIVEDAEQWLQKGPRKAKEAKLMGKAHPDRPARPPTVFFKYLMEELPIVKSKYPELSHRQVVSKIGAMYKDIKPKKLKQLKAEFVKEQESYRARLAEFYDAHPDVAPSKGPTKSTPKGTSGLNCFIAEKMKEPKFTNASKEDLKAKWANLKDEKKVPFIEMALALSAQKKSSGATTFIAKPDKDVLSKDERLVYDRFLGKPEKPPSSGFALYKNITAATKLKDMNVTERNQILQRDWNNMTRSDQNKFNNEAKIIKQQYEKKLEEYQKRVKERELKLTDGSNLTRLSSPGPGPSHVSNGESAPKRPKLDRAPSSSPEKPSKHIVVPKSLSKKSEKKFTALTWYQEQHMEEWKSSNPNCSEKELRPAIEAQFSGLSVEKQNKWARKAEKENARRGLH